MADRILTLAIETSNPSAWEAGIPVRPGVAIVSGTTAADCTTLAVEAIDPTQRHDDDLMPAIDRVVRAAGVRPTDIGRIAVSSGPGGFTAVRMAITVAKTIADTTGAVCVPVPSAMVAAGSVAHPGPFAVALASKNDSTFVTVFDADRAPRDSGRLIIAADIADLGITLLVADRFLPAAVKEMAGDQGIPVQTPIFDPVGCARMSLGLSPVDPVLVVPIYPRPPEAVRKWKELHGDRGSASTSTSS